jgi:hypothetical protein
MYENRGGSFGVSASQYGTAVQVAACYRRLPGASWKWCRDKRVRIPPG